MPDHFSSVAAQYAECRPSYPAALAAWLASQAPARDLAWDCGTGSGQAAVVLASEFERVIATDLSEAQLRHAAPHPRVEYRVGLDARSGLPDAGCDLVTAAQAAHWFDLPAFYAEADRVLKAGGVLALWGYARIAIDPAIDPRVREFELERVGRYWPPGREIATDEYRGLPFPYERIAAPAFVMERAWRVDDFLGYVRTWSAVDRCRTVEGRDPVDEIAPLLRSAWGDGPRQVRWPIHMIIGRKAS